MPPVTVVRARVSSESVASSAPQLVVKMRSCLAWVTRESVSQTELEETWSGLATLEEMSQPSRSTAVQSEIETVGKTGAAKVKSSEEHTSERVTLPSFWVSSRLGDV